VGIVVNLDGKQYYVDAGTTRFISQPIEIVLDKDQKGKFGVYKFIKDEENPGYLRLKRSRNVQNNEKLEYEDQLRIKLDEPKQMEDFIEMNEYVQTEKHPMLFYRYFKVFITFIIWPIKRLFNNIRTLCVRQSENMVYFLAGWKYSEITFNQFGETRVDKIVETIEEIRDILRNKFDLIVDDSFQPVDIQK
jgi:arylamine N-acetyltransferase